MGRWGGREGLARTRSGEEVGRVDRKEGGEEGEMAMGRWRQRRGSEEGEMGGG